MAYREGGWSVLSDSFERRDSRVHYHKVPFLRLSNCNSMDSKSIAMHQVHWFLLYARIRLQPRPTFLWTLGVPIEAQKQAHPPPEFPLQAPVFHVHDSKLDMWQKDAARHLQA